MSPRRALTLSWSTADSVVLRCVLVVFPGSQVAHGAFLAAWAAGLVPADASTDLHVLRRWLPAHVPAPAVEVTTRGDVTVEGTEGTLITFHDPSAVERLPLVTPALLTALGAELVASLLLRMVMTLAKGDPFTSVNVRRLFAIALTVVAGAILVPVVKTIVGAEPESRAVEPENPVFFSLTLSLDEGVLPLLPVGFVLAALAEVFRRGTEPREDVEGLV